MKHFGMTLNLKDDAQIIEKYKTYHADVWPETEQALKAVGITGLKIFLLGRRLFMYMQTVDEFDIDRDFPRYLEQHPVPVPAGLRSVEIHANILGYR